MTETPNPYIVSFTAGGLLLRETNAVLGLLLQENSEDLLVNEASEDRYIKINSESARKRALQEIRNRNRVVGNHFWEKYSNMSDQQQRLMLFYACLKTYKLVFDFHYDVTMPHWKKTNSLPEIFAYESKLDELSGKFDFFENLTESTRRKLVTVYRRMLTESGLVRGKSISSILLPDNFWCFFIELSDSWFLEACFLDPALRKTIKDNCL